MGNLCQARLCWPWTPTAQAAGNPTRICHPCPDDPSDSEPFGEAVYLSSVTCNGDVIGLVVSAGYGHRVGASIAMAAIDAGKIKETAYLVLVRRERRVRLVTASALYDPENSKMKG